MAAPPRAPAVSTRVVKTSPIWLTATYPRIHSASPPNSRSRSSTPQFHRNRNPIRRSAGSSTNACTTMPSVTPMPSTSSLVSPMRTGLSEISPGTSAYTPIVTMTIRLFATGAQAGGPNMCLACRIADSRANSP